MDIYNTLLTLNYPRSHVWVNKAALTIVLSVCFFKVQFRSNIGLFAYNLTWKLDYGIIIMSAYDKT